MAQESEPASRPTQSAYEIEGKPWVAFAALSGRAERLLLAGYTLYFLIAFVPWLFFSPVVAGGAPLAGCNASCPSNALMIADRPEVANWSGTDLAWAVIFLLSATIVLLGSRIATASRPRRRTLLPVYVPALILTVPLLAFHGFAAGVLHLDAEAVSTAGWFVTAGRVLMPLGFVLAIVQASFFAGSALKRLIGRIGDDPTLPGRDRGRARSTILPLLVFRVMATTASSIAGRAGRRRNRPRGRASRSRARATRRRHLA